MSIGQNKYTDKIREIITKIKEIKHIKIILCVMLIAIIMVTYASFTEKQKKRVSESTKEITDSVAYTLEEEKLADILEKIEGIGKAKVMITYSEDKNVNGVIVVAEGAGKPISEWKIRHAVQTALKIDYHSVEVYPMKQN